MFDSGEGILRRIFLVGGVLAMFTVFSVPALAQDDDLDCADFANQEEAQAEFDSDPADPNNLDADNDGEACEVFDYGVDSGGGPAQDQYSGDGCTTVAGLSGNTSKSSEPFNVGDTEIIITYATEPTNNRGFNSTDIALVDNRNFTQIDSVEAFEGEDGQFVVPVQAGRYFLDVSTFEQSYIVAAQVQGGDEECAEDSGAGNPGEPVDPPTPVPTPDPGVPGENPADEEQPKDPKHGVIEGSYPKKELADTGGLGLILPASVLMIGAGIAGFAVIRRR